MLKSEIKPGVDYAFRETRAAGAPFQRIRIIQHIRGNKWRAEWIEPNPGLVDYVESGQLIVSWKEHKPFLKDEQNAERLHEHNERQGFQSSSPVAEAVEQVFESVGEHVPFRHGVLSGPPDAIGRVRVRAGVDPKADSSVGYIDRHGILHLPFDEALELARKFSAAEPSTVLVGAEATEREWAQKARCPGEEYIVGLLNEYRASWAILRQWAGHDAAVAQREAEIEKLERLVWDAVYALQKAGLDKEASRLRRALEKR